MKTPAKLITALICIAAMLFPGNAMAAFKLKITASILPAWIFASNVIGNSAESNLLIPPGAEPHEFSMRPSDMKTLANADLLIINGMGMEPDAIKRSAKKILDLSASVNIQNNDPHIWTDPQNAIAMVESIKNQMTALDPQNASIYEKNASAYIARLISLDADLVAGLREFKGTRLITYHDSFGYFCRRYGLIPSALTNIGGHQPSAQKTRAVADMIKKENIKSIFTEPGMPKSAMKNLSDKLKARVCVLDNLETGLMNPGHYESVMRDNLKSIKECMK